MDARCLRRKTYSSGSRRGTSTSIAIAALAAWDHLFWKDQLVKEQKALLRQTAPGGWRPTSRTAPPGPRSQLRSKYLYANPTNTFFFAGTAHPLLNSSKGMRACLSPGAVDPIRCVPMSTSPSVPDLGMGRHENVATLRRSRSSGSWR
jgi:hypothetical protein